MRIKEKILTWWHEANRFQVKIKKLRGYESYNGLWEVKWSNDFGKNWNDFHVFEGRGNNNYGFFYTFVDVNFSHHELEKAKEFAAQFKTFEDVIRHCTHETNRQALWMEENGLTPDNLKNTIYVVK